MEKKEAGTATTVSAVDNNTRFLGLSGGELVQMPYTAIPEATTEDKGLMSAIDKRSNPGIYNLVRYVFNQNIVARKSFRIVFNSVPMIGSAAIKIYGSWNYGAAMGCIRKVFGFNVPQTLVISHPESSVYECSKTTATQFYITDAFIKDGKACIDIINKGGDGTNSCLIILESYNHAATVLENQDPLAANLAKSNLDETAYAFKTATASLLANTQLFTPPQIPCQQTRYQQVMPRNLRIRTRGLRSTG